MERWTLLAVSTGLISAAAALGAWALLASAAGGGGVADLVIMGLASLVLGLVVLVAAIATPGRRGPGGG
ncbi:MAG: hypothetical protein OXC99_11480 [Chloroflexi bacterium]|nr:hypothetical protein [Chloroflexota bacterium]